MSNSLNAFAECFQEGITCVYVSSMLETEQSNSLSRVTQSVHIEKHITYSQPAVTVSRLFVTLFRYLLYYNFKQSTLNP